MGRTHNQSKIRYIVAENYGWMCTYCYAHLDEDTASVDHIEPYAINHKTELDNLVLACKECNRLKADLSLLEFLLKKDELQSKLKTRLFNNEQAIKNRHLKSSLSELFPTVFKETKQ